MTREHKLALLIGFAVVLVVGILVSDHFSAARRAEHSVASTQTDPGAMGVRTLPVLAAQPREDLFGERPPRDEQDLNRPTRVPDPQRGSGTIREAEEFNMQPRPRRDTPPQLDPTPPSSPPRVDPAPITPRPTPGIKRHDVQADESLWEIAEQHYGRGSLWRDLAKFNEGRVGDGGQVRVGVTLRIPPIEMLGKTAPPIREVDPEPVKDTRVATYTVRKGDYGGLIAKQTLGSSRRWGEIVAFNRNLIDDPDDVRVGMTLRIPPR